MYIIYIYRNPHKNAEVDVSRIVLRLYVQLFTSYFPVSKLSIYFGVVIYIYMYIYPLETLSH